MTFTIFLILVLLVVFIVVVAAAHADQRYSVYAYCYVCKKLTKVYFERGTEPDLTDKHCEYCGSKGLAL